MLLIGMGNIVGQTTVTIKKSEQIRNINSKEYYIHRIEKDHTLYALSKLYNVSIEEIKFENPSAKNGLYIDQELKIPVKSREVLVRESYQSGNHEFFYHIIRNGENYARIASIYSITPDVLKASNPNLSEPLRAGQYLKIPVESKVGVVEEPIKIETLPATIEKVPNKPKVQEINYTSQPGDNLYRLALKFHVSIDEIKKLNPGLREYFYVGKEVRIPQVKNKSDYINHRVLKKEKLSNIAKYYELSYSSVLQLNPSTRNRAQAGQIIKIPAPYKMEDELAAVVVVPEEIVAEAPINRDSLRCFADENNKLKRYNVALMMPFYLEEIDSVQFNPEQPQLDYNSFRFLSFYYGTLLAIDSLEKQGLQIDLHVYDVDEDVSKAIKVINEKELREMDLIIGPFFYSAFQSVAAFAKNYRIPIVNPLSGRSEVVDNNPSIFKIQPSDRYQTEDLRKFAEQYHKNSKFFLIDNHKNLMNNSLAEYASALNEVIEAEIKIPNLDIYNLAVEKAAADTALLSAMLYNETITDSALMKPVLHPGITIEGRILSTEDIKSNIEDTTIFNNEIVFMKYEIDSLNPFKNEATVFRNNVVIVNTDDNVFALNVLTELNILRDTFPITVIGLPNWEVFRNMDKGLYENLNLHYLSSTFVEYSDRNLISFIKRYRQKYLSEPDNYAFAGFDISWYFLNALMNFGEDFEDCLQFYRPKLMRPEFMFRHNNRRDGYENTRWQLLKFHNYQLQKVNLETTSN